MMSGCPFLLWGWGEARFYLLHRPGCAAMETMDLLLSKEPSHDIAGDTLDWTWR